jgi:hypothetical protein
MRSRLSFLVALMLIASIVGAVDQKRPVETFGEVLTSALEQTPIEAIVNDPDSWVGKRVRIAGEVSGVCAHRGCWIDLTAPDDNTLRVKVEDGVIVFPQEAVGRSAEAEGEVEILEMDRKQYEAWLRHVAVELGREFDPEEVGDGPYRIVRLRGIGAEIEKP